MFEGDGHIKDFPGNYTDYRNFMAEQARMQRDQKAPKAATPVREQKPHTERPAKLSFKEQREFEALSAEIDTLTEEKRTLESQFASGEELSDVAAMSARYDEISSILDEKELRWLELSERT